MAQSDVVRVWGKVDSEDVVFRKSGKKWVCTVAPDLSDGVYSCGFFAESGAGLVSVWFGFLYMCGGICHIDVGVSPGRIVFLQNEKYGFEIMKQNYEIKFTGECEHFER